MSDRDPNDPADEAGKIAEERPASDEFVVRGDPARPEETSPDSPAGGGDDSEEVRRARRGGGRPEDGDEGEDEEEEEGNGRPPPPNLLTPESLERFRASAKFVVSLIGFPGAGKTFFLNRLSYSYARFEYDDGRTFDIDPPHDTEPVGRTFFATSHRFTRLSDSEREAAAAARSPDGSDKDFVLFDLPGELFRRSVRRGMQGDVATLLRDAIAASDALILVFPSELLFGSKERIEKVIAEQLDAAEDELDEHLEREPAPPVEEPAGEGRRARQRRRSAAIDLQFRRAEWEKRRDELEALIAELSARLEDPAARLEGETILRTDRAQLDAFVQIIGSMVARVATLKRLGMTAAEMDAMTPDEREALIKQTPYRSYAPLIYVAIAKADALLGEESPIIPLRAELEGVPRDKVDEYPLDATAVCEPAIYKGIATTFRWYRFDFLTSFKGQSHNVYGAIGSTDFMADQTIQYDLPNYGVTGVIEWLEFAKRKAAIVGRRGIGSWRAAAELSLVRRAERSIGHERGVKRGKQAGWLDRLARHFVQADPARLRKWLLGLAAAAALVALYTTGIVAAALVTVGGNAGGYALAPQPRYPVEVSRLRESEPFRQAFLSSGARPWSGVPADGRMFAVPPSRRVRDGFVTVLEDLRQLPPTGRIGEPVGREFVERLGRLQAEMNEEYANESGEGRYRERPIINYHTGYVQLRMGHPAATQSFNRTLELLTSARADGRAEEGRLLGVRIAVRHALGLALLNAAGGEAEAASRELDTARAMLPGAQSDRRILLTHSRTGLFFEFDPARTPAALNTADLWSDSLAAHIRAFDAATDLLPDSAMSRLLDELKRAKPDIPRDHPLAVNYLIGEALLGRPLSEARMTVDAADPDQQAAARAAMRSLGGSGSEADVWAGGAQLRSAFAAGDGDAVRRIIDRWSASGTVPEADTAFVRTLASEIVSGERLRLPRSQRGPLLAAFGEYVRGAGFLSLANDLSRFGGIVPGLLLPVLLGLLLFAAWRIHAGSRETFAMLLQPRHRADRLGPPVDEGGGRTG